MCVYVCESVCVCVFDTHREGGETAYVRSYLVAYSVALSVKKRGHWDRRNVTYLTLC